MTQIGQPPASQRWIVPLGLIILGFGVLATGAGGLELLSNHDLEPGWSRYQPPWTMPAFITGLAFILVGLAVLTASHVISKRRDQRR